MRETIKQMLPDSLRRRMRCHRAHYRWARRTSSVAQEYLPSVSRNALQSAWRIARASLRPRRIILTCPDAAREYSVLYKACALGGHVLTCDVNMDYDLAIQFRYHTYTDPADLAVVANGKPLLNARCLDIGKSRVGQAFERVFGYPVSVDPLTCRRPMVEKSELNYAHDGRVVTGPLRPEQVRPGAIYQVEVDNTDGQGNVIDLRVPIFASHIPFAYLKYKPQSVRFGSQITVSHLCETQSLFSGREIEQMLAMAAEMGLDFGEMDVLRDSRDGRIYIVDVNNTASGPAKGLSDRDRIRAMQRLTAAFDQLIDQQCRQAARRGNGEA